MENLPEHILEDIFRFCLRTDLLSVACCSKPYYALAKPFIWQTVRVPVCRLNTKRPRNLQNLKFTRSLTIMDIYYDGDGIHNPSLRAEVDMIDDAFKSALEIGLILADILKYCNPLKIRSLYTSLHGKGLAYVFDTLQHIKCLKLCIDGRVEGEHAKKLVALEDLELLGCAYLTDRRLTEFLDELNLIQLKVIHCNLLSPAILTPISKQKNLRSLALHFLDVAIPINFEPLSSLSSLTHLSIKSGFVSESLKSLCRSLTKLKSLDLSGSMLQDDSLKEIRCLTSLTHLALIHCIGITPHCLCYLDKQMLLCCLNISSDLFNLPPESHFCLPVSNLNSLVALRKVVLNHGCKERCYNSNNRNSNNNNAHKALLVMNSLCDGAKWTLNYTSSDSVYTFTR